MFATDDTIVAIATPPGRGGLGVVRLSGPAAREIGGAILERRAPLEPRRATLTRARCARAAGAQTQTSRAIDQVLCTYFPAPASYTGEDVVEISAHGSPVLLDAIVGAAVDAGARLARPGEFTLRAFLNGRIDLVQAEAVADLIEAATPLQARVAFDQLEGTLTARIAAIDEGLFDVVARLEASLDFPDEGYRFIEAREVGREIGRVATEVETLLADAGRGRLIREGRTAVIAGKPNVGKSSVFNYLVGVDRAIVSAEPGTTRDLVSERLDLDGIPLTLVDGAGVRPATNAVEQEGVARARAALASAGLAIVVLDRSAALEDDDRALIAETAGTPRVVVANKCDLPARWYLADLPCQDAIEVSMRTREGSEALRAAMRRAIGAREDLREEISITNLRHIDLLRRAHRSLARAIEAASSATPEEFVLADLQGAREALEEIVGVRTADDVLRQIFERFCVGK